MTMTTLGEIAEWGSGGTPKRSVGEYFGDGVPWLSIADLNDGIVVDARESLTDSGIRNSSAKIVPQGTILVAMYGSIGKLGVAGCDMCTSQAIAYAKPDLTLVDRAYLFHYLLAERPNLQALGRGGTQMNIGQSDLKRWPIRLPPLADQQRVAEILDQANSIPAKRRRVLTQLDTLTQSIFHEIFGDPLSSSPKILVKPLQAWIDSDRPITYGILKPGPEIETGVPYVRVADMKDRGIDVQNIRRTSSEIAFEYRRATLKAGDLLVSIRGHVGRFAFVPPELSGANITQDSARLAIRDPDTALYVRAAMETPSMQHWMAKRTKGAAVKGINLGDLREAPLPVPSSGQQRIFASCVKRIDTQRAVVRRALDADNELFASLQARAFRGEL